MRSAGEATHRHRVVVLTGPDLWHRNTCATLIAAGLDVRGVCVADQRRGGLPLGPIKRGFRRRGWRRTVSQIAGRVAYEAMNRRDDRAALRRLFDAASIEAALRVWGGPVHRTDRYDSPGTLAWLDGLGPDVLVVHSPYWVGKKVRELARAGVVLGGHPGLTPHYRGSHSAFWAVYQGRPEDVGCSVFLLDDGVDTGDVVAQDLVAIEPGDSYVTAGWKGMARIAELQARALADFDRGIPIPRRAHAAIPPGSEYPLPSLGDYVRYYWRQRGSRVLR